MKKICALTLALVFSGAVSASDLNERALKALLSTKVSLTGDVHSYETMDSIYSKALDSGAVINNNCEVVKNSNNAKCILWLTFSPMGETAREYSVVLPGDELSSNVVSVSRGD